MSVIVPISDHSGTVVDLVRSLDQQSLRYEEFEVFFVDCGSRDGTPERLRRLVQNRPNMRLVEEHAPGSGDVLNDCLVRAQGEFVILLDPVDQLFPEALERLQRYGAEHQADLVVGRRSLEPASPLGDMFFKNHLRLKVQLELPAPVMAYRRAYLAQQEIRFSAFVTDARDIEFQSAARDATHAVAVLSEYPAIRSREMETSAAASPQPGVHLILGAPAVSWYDGRLQLAVPGELRRQGEKLGQESLSDMEPILLLRHTETGLECGVPCRVQVVSPKGDASTKLHLEAEVDILTAADGLPLPYGPWTMEVHLRLGPELTCAASIAGRERKVAVVDGLLVGLSGSGDTLKLEVGTISLNICEADPDSVSIHETAAGTRLTMRLPQIATHGSSCVDGRLFSARLALPAQVTVGAGEARMECYVSGLAGVYPLSSQFGTARPMPTGLDLVISGTGDMAVVRSVGKTAPTRRLTKKPRPKQGRPASTQQKAAPTTVQRLRRRVPRRLEPMVMAVARRPAARRAYRRLAGLAGNADQDRVTTRP